MKQKKKKIKKDQVIEEAKSDLEIDQKELELITFPRKGNRS